MKSLVTGGAGLIGSHIVDELLSRGDGVRILDRLDPQTHPHGKPSWVSGDAEFVQGDVRDRDCLAGALAGVECIYHQAAFGGFTDSVSTYLDHNATGTARLFEAVAGYRDRIRKVVVASSQAVYAEGRYRCDRDGLVQPPMRPLDQLERGEWEVRCPDCGEPLTAALTGEDARTNGVTPYAISKLSQERIALGMGRRLGLATVALRYAVTYGPRQSMFNPYTGIMSIFSTLLLNGMAPKVFEDGLQTRDFVFVRDVARANLAAMHDARADGDVLNVSRGQSVRVGDLVEVLAGVYGIQPRSELNGEFRPDDVRHLTLDPASLGRLGWTAQKSLEDGVAEFARWVEGLGDVKEYFRGALDRLRASGVVRSAAESLRRP